MREAVWGSIRALGEKGAQDRHYARFYEGMIENNEHVRWPVSATPGPVDAPHDSWKERYRPDPWTDQVLLWRKVLSVKVPLSGALQETLQLVQRVSRPLCLTN